MINSRFLIISLLLFATSCGHDEETKNALEVSKQLYKARKDLDQAIEESNRRLGRSNRRLDSMMLKLKETDGEFEKVTPITDAKKEVGADSVRVEVLEYED